MPTTPLGMLFLGAAGVSIGLAILGTVFGDMHSPDQAQRVGIMWLSCGLFAIASAIWR